MKTEARAGKKLRDIRYFVGSEVPAPGRSIPSRGGALDIPRDAHRLGQRIACVLEADGLSLGDYDHLYVVLTPALRPREVQATGYGIEPWFRYVAYGIEAEFRQWAEPRKLQFIEDATFDCLEALAPGSRALIGEARTCLRKDGDRVRVLRARKEIASHVFEVWFDIPPLDEKAYLYVVATDKATAKKSEAPPIPLADYEHAFPLVSAITCSKGNVNLVPRRSFRASLSTTGYESPIRIPLAAFDEKSNKK